MEKTYRVGYRKQVCWRKKICNSLGKIYTRDSNMICLLLYDFLKLPVSAPLTSSYQLHPRFTLILSDFIFYCLSTHLPYLSLSRSHLRLSPMSVWVLPRCSNCLLISPCRHGRLVIPPQTMWFIGFGSETCKTFSSPGDKPKKSITHTHTHSLWVCVGQSRSWKLFSPGTITGAVSLFISSCCGFFFPLLLFTKYSIIHVQMLKKYSVSTGWMIISRLWPALLCWCRVK